MRKQPTRKTKRATGASTPPAPHIPAFRSEAEEAAWWDSHPATIEALFERGIRAGKVTRGEFLRRIAAPETRPTTIRLLSDDVARAKLIAHRKGIRYQTYLKMLIHEAVRREEKAGRWPGAGDGVEPV